MKPRQLGSRQRARNPFSGRRARGTEAVPIPQVRYARRDLKDEHDSFRYASPCVGDFFLQIFRSFFREWTRMNF